ncbi:MAG: hypothetical protein BWY76_02534 [bacterium ADurb.Bin429]|nr:MAG: hypothetical protein BWY76_02534 [bacterium ADurb.Bin429]
MSLHRLLLLAAFASLLAASSFGQGLNADLPKLSSMAFGWVSMSGVDPTLDAMASFAPTMLGIREAGYFMGGEAATGTFSFSGFDIDSGWESAQTNLGPGVFRLAHYGFSSNTAEVAGMALPPGVPPGTPPLLLNTYGDSIEVSYAQRLGNTGVGISLVPSDSATVSIYQGGATVAAGKSKTDYGYRIGAVAPLKGAPNVRVGANFSYQKDESSLTPNAAHPLVIATGAVPDSGRYITRAYTIGASGNVAPRTTVYGSYQKIFGKGGSMDREAELVWFGVTQQLTNTVAVRANYLDGGLNVGVTCRTPVGLLIAAYTNKALTNAKDVLGDGDSLFVGIDIAK